MSPASFQPLEAQPLAALLPAETQEGETRVRPATRLPRRQLDNRLRLRQRRCRVSRRIRHSRERGCLSSRKTAFRRRLSQPSHVLLPLAKLMERPRALGYQGVDRRAETGAWFKNSQQPGRSWGSLSPSIRRKSCRVFLTITTARRVDARSWDDAKSLQRPLPGRCHSRAGPTRMTSRLSEFGPAQFIVLLLKFADRCSRFVNNLAGLLVGAKSEIYRVAHLACRRPFGELYFSHQCRLDPGGDGFVLHPRGKRRLCDLERQKLAVKFFKDLVGETRADMADITPGVLVAQGKNERAEELA